jgi:hypothetical protein
VRPAPEVEQAPLPPIEPRDLLQPNTGSPKPKRPFIFENILRSLGQ